MMTANAPNTYILPIEIVHISNFNVQTWYIDKTRNLPVNKLKLF